MKVFIDSIGCRLNQSEAESIGQSLVLNGYQLAATRDHADISITNTCAVTAAASRDSRKALRKNQHTIRIATGCDSDNDANYDADLVVNNIDKDDLVAQLLRIHPPSTETTPKQYNEPQSTLAPTVRAYDAPQYPLLLGGTRAFVKIQDGCSLSCSYCVTTIARGDSRSRSIGDIVADVQSLASKGANEVVLTGVHAAAFGRDTQNPNAQTLDSLLLALLQDTDMPRIRLSSIEPWNFESAWFDLFAQYADRLCPSFHMSLQSGSRSVLRRMRRAYTPKEYAAKVNDARKVLDKPCFTTDVITGFCGETAEEHQETLDFLVAIRFAGVHAFPYSQRHGTPAAQLQDDVSPQIKRERRKQVTATVRKTGNDYATSLAGESASVLWLQRTGTDWNGICQRGLVLTPHSAANPQPNRIESLQYGHQLMERQQLTLQTI